MTYGRIHLRGRYILLEDMSYGSHGLWEDMSYGRTCLTGGHVLQEDMLIGGQVLQEDISYRTCFIEGMSYGRSCFR